MKVSVIIPFYGKWELTHQRMMDLYKWIPFPIEIVMIDDCSLEDHTDRMNWWKRNTKHSVITIRTEKNLGFGSSMNFGCSHATGDIFILLSNDVQIFGDFIGEILLILNRGEKVLIGNELYNYDTGWNVRNINGKSKLFPYLGGYLIACTRETWEDLGGFDPIYGKFDCEDIDLSTTALHKGYSLVPLNYRRLRHFHGQTIRKLYPDREKYTEENLLKFDKKWSKILRDEK